jgi:hypothetical protein
MVSILPFTSDQQLMLVSQLENWFKSAAKQAPSMAEMQRAAEHLHQLLLLESGYLSLTKTAFELNPDLAHPWGWIPIIQTPEVHAGLLTTYRFHPVPLHDHPNSNGAQLVIRGRVNIHRFNLLQSKETSQSLAKLERLSSNTLSAGDTDGHTATSGNIHRLETETPRCLLLCVHVPPYEERQRSWYIPVDTLTYQKPTQLVRRVSRQPPW